MKLTVQDLAMFIGCEVEVYYSNPIWIKEKHPKYKLNGVNIKDNEISIESYTGVPMWYSLDSGWEYLKPVLRHLSDMTEQEELMLRPFRVYNFSEGQRRWNETPDSLRILISMRFDIFGWIGKGLAISQSNLKSDN